MSNLFNGRYRYTYLTLAELFSPEMGKSDRVDRLYRLISRTFSELALFLVRQTISGVGAAAPAFEIAAFASDDPLSELVGLAAQVAQIHPDLGGVAETIA